MGKMIYVGSKCKNPKKKPGWRDTAAQEAEWLKSVQSIQLFSSTKFQPSKAGNRVPGRSPVVEGTLVGHDRPREGTSLGGFASGGTKKVHRPEIVYKDDPEMLARELKARGRKFAVAPAYNKGGDQLVTDEVMKDITAGKTRRR